MIGKKLVIISHTEHRLINGEVFGWGPTVEEVNYLSNYFGEIAHIGCLEPDNSLSASYRKYLNDNINYLPIPTFGGKSFWKKLSILLLIPKVLKQVERGLVGATHVQLRVPMGIGLFLIPYFTLRKRNFIFWVKYANNWGDTKPKFGFRLQRYMLRKNWLKCKVTINGSWPNQPKHCISFQNPSLYLSEIFSSLEISKIKKYVAPFKLIFVGRVEEEKGVGIILDWFKRIDNSIVQSLTIIGTGKDYILYKDLASKIDKKIIFLGNRSREEIHEYYKQSHFLLLPSMASEGFPKVVSEALAFGCIPITSSVSSLAQFLSESGAGIEWKILDSCGIENIEVDNSLIEKGILWSEKFTFENYKDQLKKEVFH